jgi:hypothetical protein
LSFLPRNTHLADRGAANHTGTDELGADLIDVIDAWPDLPEALQNGILAMVWAASRE